MLHARIALDADAVEMALAEPPPDPAGDRPDSPPPGHHELSRQLSALRGRVARVGRELGDLRELRAELATLSHFAQTLRQDAQAWRSDLHQTLLELRRGREARRQEQARQAAERDFLLRQRDLLQARIDRAAAQVARATGECRRTVPVIRLADTVTVCSMTVSAPRRRFRARALWLVTLGSDRDHVLVRPQ